MQSQALDQINCMAARPDFACVTLKPRITRENSPRNENAIYINMSGVE